MHHHMISVGVAGILVHVIAFDLARLAARLIDAPALRVGNLTGALASCVYSFVVFLLSNKQRTVEWLPA